MVVEFYLFYVAKIDEICEIFYGSQHRNVYGFLTHSFVAYWSQQ